MQGARRGLGAVAAAAALGLALLAGAPAGTASAAPQPPQLDARAWTLVDAADGEVLAGRRAGSSYPVASATKLMTAYVARRALRPGERIVAPAYQANTAESLLGLVAGERIEVRDLLYGLLLASGNDAAVALAEGAAGSVDAFVARMNGAARRLDLDDSSYANPIGLDEAGNHSSAADLVELTLVLRRDPLFRRIFDSPEAVLESGARTRTVVNRNNLVRTVPWVNGVKTGYTLGAGNVLVGSGSRRGTTLVSAVLGAPSEAARDVETLELLEYGFSLYRRERPLRRGERLAAPELRYQDERLGLVATRDVSVTVRRDQQVRTAIEAPAEVEGPVAKGERLGTVVVSVDGEQVERVPLAAARAAPAATLLQRYDAAIPGPRPVAWLLAIAALTALLALGALWLGRRREGPQA